MKIDSILCHRLFGYGIPYRVKCDKGVGFSVVETSAEQEAKVLASYSIYSAERNGAGRRGGSSMGIFYALRTLRYRGPAARTHSGAL